MLSKGTGSCVWAGPDSGGCQVPALVVPLPPACPWRHPSGPGAPCPAPRSRAGSHHPGFGLHCRPGWRGAHHPPPLCPVSWHKARRCRVTPSLPSDPCTPACRSVWCSGEGTPGLPSESWLPSLWHSRPSLEGSHLSTRVSSSERPAFLEPPSCGRSLCCAVPRSLFVTLGRALDGCTCLAGPGEPTVLGLPGSKPRSCSTAHLPHASWARGCSLAGVCSLCPASARGPRPWASPDPALLQ